jgi:chemosensory pili system protein ChpC
VVVPGSVVAEVVEYSEPKEFERAPDWLEGEISWSGWNIPLVNLARLAGTDPLAERSPRGRFLVLRTLTDASSVLHVAVMISGLPKLHKLTRGNLEETGEDTVPGVFAHVKIGDQAGLIPDLEALALTIEAAVYRNH